MLLAEGLPIFSHLEDVSLSGDEKGTTLSGLPLFVSPSLRRVSVEVPPGDSNATESADIMESFLSIMQERGHPLQHLSVVAKIPVSVSQFFSTLSRSNTLRVLRLEGIRVLDADETNWVAKLGLIEGLEDLKLVAEEDVTGRVPPAVLTLPKAPRAKGTVYRSLKFVM